MKEAQNYMRLEIMAKPENISLARLTIATFASQLDFTLTELEEIKVVVSETVSNSIIHGYQGNPGSINITASIQENKMELIVEDKGQGITDIELAKQPSYTTDPDNRMGLGLSFIDSFMDELDIISAPNQGTKVVMIKYLLKGNEEE